ncbi:MAG: aminofutalosine synthase MqnE [Bacteroidales bacterium]|nr:aminofutalosine synthase MqnE [Bacteroidales bacterium]
MYSKQRLTPDEGLRLYKAELGELGILADYVRKQKNGNNVYYNKNIHLEPTNVCVYDCKFCSYHRKKNEDGSWENTISELLDKVKTLEKSDITEVHIVGGVHPNRDLNYYGELIREIKKIIPNIHIKAFTAVELDFMIKNAKMSLSDGLAKLKEYGLDSIPGGGAEIFNAEIRKEICYEKSSSEKWLTIHENAHKLDIPSNATMLYAHIENYEHRIEHLTILRDLQDRTSGFNSFIPLKYKNTNNRLSYIGEVNTLEDLKNFAVSRIYLDNFNHIKAYWPMIGKDVAQLALSFGVDDIDGTINDTTKIYSMAGGNKNPAMSEKDIIQLISEVGKKPVERDSCYNIISEH